MQTALVTGASTGIGLATALHLARHRFHVYAGVRDPEGAVDLHSAIREMAREVDWEDGCRPVAVVRLDVCDEASIAAAMAEMGPVDVLVNNAGIGGGGQPVETASIEIGKHVFDTNYWGALRMIQAVLPAMREKRQGTIVNITSMLGRLTLGSGAHYAASKHALEAASEVLAQETALFGIRVAMVEPGVILTPIFGKKIEAVADDSPYYFSRRRLRAFFQAQMKSGTLPLTVAETVLHAIRTDAPQLRYVVGRDAEALLAGRAAVNDADWIADFAVADDEEFYDRMVRRFGLDLWRRPANPEDAN